MYELQLAEFRFPFREACTVPCFLNQHDVVSMAQTGMDGDKGPSISSTTAVYFSPF